MVDLSRSLRTPDPCECVRRDGEPIMQFLADPRQEMERDPIHEALDRGITAPPGGDSIAEGVLGLADGDPGVGVESELGLGGPIEREF